MHTLLFCFDLSVISLDVAVMCGLVQAVSIGNDIKLAWHDD